MGVKNDRCPSSDSHSHLFLSSSTFIPARLRRGVWPCAQGGCSPNYTSLQLHIRSRSTSQSPAQSVGKSALNFSDTCISAHWLSPPEKKPPTGRWLIQIGPLLQGALSKALELYRFMETFRCKVCLEKQNNCLTMSNSARRIKDTGWNIKINSQTCKQKHNTVPPTYFDWQRFLSRANLVQQHQRWLLSKKNVAKISIKYAEI